MEVLLLIVGLALFLVLIVVHEFGHFIMARRNGVEVEEFGVGFPPRALTLKKDKQGTKYTLNWLPLGGFVRLKGEHDSDKETGSFGAASFRAKANIILAGVVMNLVVAWLIFTILALIGLPKLPLPGGEEQYTVASDTTVVSNRVFVGYVEKGGPADTAGIKTGDQITQINDDKLRCSPESFSFNQSNRPAGCRSDNLTCIDCDAQDAELRASELRQITEESLLAGSTKIVLSVEGRGDIQIEPRSYAEVKASIDANRLCNMQPIVRAEPCPQTKGYLGIEPHDLTIQRSTWSAPIVGAGLIAQYSRLTYVALGDSIVSLFQGKGSEASDNVSGPIGIFVVLKEGASFGPSYILLIVGLLSLTLAIMNTLPIPALDGGKLFVMLLFRAIRRPLTAKLEESIHGSGFVGLMLLFVLITVVDIKRFF